VLYLLSTPKIKKEKSDMVLSIFIPTYNRSTLLRRQLLFFQREIEGLEKEVELVVSDNCSTDGTWEILQEFQSHNLIINRNEVNLGIAGNQFQFPRLCKGEWVLIASDDDYYEDGVVLHILSIIKRYRDLAYIYLTHNQMLDYKYENRNISKQRMEGIKYGYFNRAIDFVLPEFLKKYDDIIFTSSTVIKAKYYKDIMKLISYSDIEAYGINEIAPLYAMKNGGSYFDKKIWVHAGKNISWSDISDDSYRGRIFAHALLKNLGFSRRELKIITRNEQKSNTYYWCMRRTFDRNKSDFWKTCGVMFRCLPFETFIYVCKVILMAIKSYFWEIIYGRGR